MTDTIRVGLDLGGTKIEGIALDADGIRRARGRACRRRAATTPPRSRPSAALVEQLEREAGGAGHGRRRACPGAISPATGLREERQLHLADRPAVRRRPRGRARPAGALRQRRQLLRAVGGRRRRGRRRATSVFGVIVGTGTGGGVVVNGRVLTGANAIAGEWGHNPLPWPRRRGVARAAVLLRPHRLHRDVPLRTGPRARLRARTAAGRERRRDRAARAAAGDRGGERVRSRATRIGWRARWRRVINVLDPDVIVLGGGMSNVDRLYARVPALWTPFVFSDAVTTRLVKAVHGDSSGVRGAAWSWPRDPAPA